MLRVPYDHDEIIEFALGPHRNLSGGIRAEDPEQITWSIRIECRQARFRNLAPRSVERLREQKEYADFLTGVTCHAEITDLSFPVTSWRDLAGQRIDLEYTSDDLHPIMPDLSAVFFYESQHFAANQNQIAIGKRNGCIFDFTWKFNAEESEQDVIAGVEIKTNIAFREFRVYFKDPATRSAKQALNTVLQWCDGNDLGKPKAFRDFCVVFPIRADVV